MSPGTNRSICRRILAAPSGAAEFCTESRLRGLAKRDAERAAAAVRLPQLTDINGDDITLAQRQIQERIRVVLGDVVAAPELHGVHPLAAPLHHREHGIRERFAAGVAALRVVLPLET